MGVYGRVLNAFPELRTRIRLIDDHVSYMINGVYLDASMEGMTGVRFSKGNTAVDIRDQSILYVDEKQAHLVKVGMHCRHPFDGTWMRVTKRLGYNRTGGYATFQLDKLTGASPEQNKKLNVKEAVF